jgi:hypothetical protein
MHAIYRKSLRRHAHELIAMGYQALCAEDFEKSQEPEITGELVRAMREVLEKDTAPPWAEYYAIHDDPALNVPGKRGKTRPRVDIEFERVTHGIRPRLRFEAKRLGRNYGVTKYLGADGLGCFTSGKYPLTHPEAGMLGYVQNRDEAVWASKLATALSQKPDTYWAIDDILWEQHRITPRLVHTYHSKHYCQALGEGIDIFHILLRFCRHSSSTTQSRLPGL